MKKFIFLIMSILMCISCTTMTPKKSVVTKKEKETVIVNASTKTDKNLVYLYNEDKLVGTLTIEEFKALIKDAKAYNEILKAEKDGRIKVVLKDNPWKLDLKGSVYTTYLTIFWKDSEGKQLKKVVIKITLDVPKEGKKMSKIRVVYRDIAEIGLPLSTLLLIIFFAL